MSLLDCHLNGPCHTYLSSCFTLEQCHLKLVYFSYIYCNTIELIVFDFYSHFASALLFKFLTDLSCGIRRVP